MVDYIHFNTWLIRACLIVSLMVGTVSSAWAVPAKPVTIHHTQKDGTELTLTLVGDEYMSYYTTLEGRAMRQGEDGDYYVITDLTERQAKASIRRAQANQQRVQRLRSHVYSDVPGPKRTIGKFSKMEGTKRGLVILVNFNDVKFQSGNDVAAFRNQFNQEGYSKNGHIGSVKDYFSAQSYGTFTVDFDVVGPVTVSHNMSYYGEHKENDNDSYPASMVIEAIKLADTQYSVDYTKYDWNGDGYVDQVFVIYAGYNEAQGGANNTIWPHEWTLSSANYYGDGTGRQRIDGKYIDTYACTSELCGSSGSTMDGIGTACHEFSHCLGYPDLYDTDGTENGSGFGMSYYDLMAGGSYNGPNGNGEIPCGYSAYERWMAGWIAPTELTEAASISGMVTIDNQVNGGNVVSNSSILANSPSRAYMIKNGSDNDYYLLENRPNTGYYSYYGSKSSGSGLFITHVQYNEQAWTNNKVNAYSTNQRLIFIPADGTYSNSSKNWLTDFYPTSSVKSFNSVSGKAVTNIQLVGGLISFDFMGGFQDDGSRYTITLDAGAGSVSRSSWTQSSYNQAWTLPEPTTSVEGWYGAGWSLQKILTNTPLDDVDLIDYDKPYIPEQDVTLYAVYMDEDFFCNYNPVSSDNGGGDNSGVDTPSDIRPSVTFSTYYSAADNKQGEALVLALEDAIDNHTIVSYDNLKYLLKYADTKDADGVNLIDIYSDHQFTISGDAITWGSAGGDENVGVALNREHTVPQSWFHEVSPMVSDAFHIYSTDAASNGHRSNNFYGECSSGSSYTGNGCKETGQLGTSVAGSGYSGAVYEPADEYKGDIARSYFYMAVRYYSKGSNAGNKAATWGNMFGTDNYSFTSYTTALMLKWHREDPVSEKELIRNEVIYGNSTYNKSRYKQGNRNPFIDYPELAEYIWGNKAGQTFSLASAISAYDGSTDSGDDDSDDIPKQASVYFPHIAHLGKAFTAPMLNVPVGFTATLTYSSSNTDVATVDSESGAVTIKAVGTTIITVTSAETDTYAAGSASYMIKVVE